MFKRGDRVELSEKLFDSLGCDLFERILSMPPRPLYIPWRGNAANPPMPGSLGWVLGYQQHNDRDYVKVCFHGGKTVLVDEYLLIPFPGEDV